MSQWRLCLIAVVLLAVTRCADSTVAAEDRYVLNVEILIQPTPADRLRTREWGDVFYKMGRRVTFRQGRHREKTTVEDTSRGTLKSLRVIGILNRDGSVSFRGRTFSIREPEELQKWLDSLEKYGPLGPPEKSPTWGLSSEQLTQLLKYLAEPVTDPIDRRSLSHAIRSLRLHPKLRVDMQTLTSEPTQDIDSRLLATSMTGLSKGSALAVILAQHGLGFRPQPAREDTFVLKVLAGNESDNLYPVGWKNTAPIVLVVPELMKPISVDLQDAPIEKLIGVIAARIRRLHFYSVHALKAAGINIQQLKYSRKPDRLTLYRLMDIVSKTHHIALSVRTDEAGSTFLWVTTPDEEAAFQKRFAHVKAEP